MVGINSDVVDMFEKYKSSKLCANTTGQVEAVVFMHNEVRTGLIFR